MIYYMWKSMRGEFPEKLSREREASRVEAGAEHIFLFVYIY